MEKLLKETFYGIQHTGIPVSDIKVSESFYNKLGFDTVMRSQFFLICPDTSFPVIE